MTGQKLPQLVPGAFCIAEHLVTVWDPYHTQFDLPAEASVVSIVATEGPNSCNNHYDSTGEAVLRTIADCMAHYGQTAWYYRSGGFVVAIVSWALHLALPDDD